MVSFLQGMKLIKITKVQSIMKVIKGTVSDFWETVLKVDRTNYHNTFVANQHQGACPLMMGEENPL